MQPYGVAKNTFEPAQDEYGPSNYQEGSIETPRRSAFQEKVDAFRNTAHAVIFIGSSVWIAAEHVKPGITQDTYEAAQQVIERAPGGPLTTAIASAALVGASTYAKLRKAQQEQNSTTGYEQ